jgi:hypothetical protein
LVGARFVIDKGAWEGLPEPTYTYAWYRCDSPTPELPTSSTPRPARTVLPEDCEPIAEQDGNFYEATGADAGAFILGAVTGTNNGGYRTYFTETSQDPIEAKYELQSIVSVSPNELAISPGQSISITRTDGTWSKPPQSGSPVLIHRWVYCKNPISQGGQFFDIKNCQMMFPADYDTNALDPADLQRTLTLDMATPFAGYYIASVEYLLKPGSPAGLDNPATRITYRTSATTGKIKIAPKRT